MKTHKNLFQDICSFENLLFASQKPALRPVSCFATEGAQRGKRFDPNALAFNHNLESNIFKLQDELTAPKGRWIAA
ncbi:MAG: hypothetical protein Q8O74_01840 [bacterium]|nr:hypothetical protein [bacterium]